MNSTESAIPHGFFCGGEPKQYLILRSSQISNNPHSRSPSPLSHSRRTSSTSTGLSSCAGSTIATTGLELPRLRYLDRPPSSISMASSNNYGDRRRSLGVSTAGTTPGGEGSAAQGNPPPAFPRAGPSGGDGYQTRVRRRRSDSSEGGRTYRLDVIQQPECGAEFGWGLNTLGRLPVVPAVVVRLVVTQEDGSEVSPEDLSPSLICSCSLLAGSAEGPGANTPLDTVERLTSDAAHPRESRTSLVGAIQAGISRARPLRGNRPLETYFVFSDFAVRVPGEFRLRFTLVDARPMTAHPSSALASVITQPFQVVPFSQYPGATRTATDLSRHLASSGIALYLPPYSSEPPAPPA